MKRESSSLFPRARYLEEPFPSAIDRSALRYVSFFAGSDDAARATVCESPMNAWQVDALLAFAERMASVSVLQRDVKLVEAGLIALVILGTKVSFRASWRVMVLLQSSAAQLTPKPDEIFYKAALRASSRGVRDLLEAIVYRDSDGRII